MTFLGMFSNFTEANWIAFGTASVALAYNVFNTVYARRLAKGAVRRSRFNDDVKRRIGDYAADLAKFGDWLEEHAISLERSDISNFDEKKILDDFNKIRRDGVRVLNDIVGLGYDRFSRCDESFMDYFYQKYADLCKCEDSRERLKLVRLLARECGTFRMRVKAIALEYEDSL